MNQHDMRLVSVELLQAVEPLVKAMHNALHLHFSEHVVFYEECENSVCEQIRNALQPQVQDGAGKGWREQIGIADID